MALNVHHAASHATFGGKLDAEKWRDVWGPYFETLTQETGLSLSDAMLFYLCMEVQAIKAARPQAPTDHETTGPQDANMEATAGILRGW